MHNPLRTALLMSVAALALVVSPLHAAPSTDIVTGLPLYPTAGTPDTMQHTKLCRSNATINIYALLSGTDAAALTWLSANLHGFAHTHEMGMNRRQDMFIKADGTVAVGATSNPDLKGLYGLSYMRFSPPLTAAQQVQVGKLFTSC